MKPLPSDGQSNPTGASPILRDALELTTAAETRIARHHATLGIAWSPSGPREFSRGPRTDVFHLDTHDEAVIRPCMGEAQAWRLRHAWERHPELRRGAVALYRRALAGVLAMADRGMRQRGWEPAGKDTASSHLAGAAWTKEGDGVALQAWIDSGLPRQLLAPLEQAMQGQVDPDKGGRQDGVRAVTRIQCLEEEADPDNAWWRHSIRVVARLRAVGERDNPGRAQLAEALAEGIWRMGDPVRPGAAHRAEGIALEEPRFIEERVADLPTLFFRRETPGGRLPRALRQQLGRLRGGVIFREVLEERTGLLALPVGTMLRPEGTWDMICVTGASPAANGIPQIERGEIVLREPDSAILLSPIAPREIRLGADKLFPEEFVRMGWRDVAIDRGEGLLGAAVETERFEELG